MDVSGGGERRVGESGTKIEWICILDSQRR